MTRPGTAVRLSAIAVTAAYAGLLHLSGLQLNSLAKQAVALIPAVLAVGLSFYDVLLWRFWLLHRFTKRPWIGGLWRVELLPTPESQIPPGGNRGPIRAYMVVRQTFWSLSVRLMTKESASRSRSFSWEPSNNGDFDQLAFVYDNTPRQQVQARSPRHYGLCLILPVAAAPVTLQGSYFTDRYTKGDMDMQLVQRRYEFSSYAEAEAADRQLTP